MDAVNVVINGVRFYPAVEKPTGNNLIDALNVRFSFCGDEITIRDYLHSLLSKLWKENEGFSGKRPFGNSGWDYDIYEPLIKHEYISGELDSNGYVESVDKDEAYKFVLKLIDAMCYGVAE